MIEQPLRGHDRQAVEGMAQRFSYTHQSIDRSNLGQHMGGIGALFAARFEPSPLLKERQHGRQELFLSMAFEQARAELTQHRGIKTGIREVQAKCILHINAAPYRISSLPI